MEVEGVVAALTSDPGDAHAAEGSRDVPHQERVDPHRPRPHRPANSLGTLLGAGEDDARQAVAGRVGQSHRLFLVGEGLEGEYRAEYLALHNLRVVGSGDDQGRFVPQSLGDRLASHPYVVTGGSGPLYESMHLVPMVGMDHGSDGRGRIPAVSHDVGADMVVETLQELVTDRLLYQ